ncbi:phage tail tape measure protein [Frankia sp. AgW1.1]|uniref:phage tail tape measure protein n=1 Tax=Frankia sp. AgW1.1 TaxID=1836971 RepID=UPI0019311ECE|nr:phage tail tape measure protein [Frankia sp. AgW1.1]MBL7487076.1 phage tail tape measure protein [Frankia sp. AgW1.1]
MSVFSGILPPAVIHLVADAAEFAASMKEAGVALAEFAEAGATAVKAADDAMAASGAEAAEKWGYAWNIEWTRQAEAAEAAALRMEVAQQRVLTEGTREFVAAQEAQAAAAAKADAAMVASRTRAMESMSKAVATAGKVSAAAFALVAVESVHLAADFDAQMEKLNSQLGMSIPQVNALKSQVLDLAGKVGQSPDSLAEALLHVEAATKSLGSNGPKAMDVLAIAGKAAAVSGANLVDVTNALDAAMVSGLPGMENLSKAAGQLVAAVGEGDMSMQDMADAFGKGNVAIWKNYGLSITDVTASLALFGDMNLRGAAAGTAMTNTMKYLLHPAASAPKYFDAMGLSVDKLSKDITSGGLPKAIADIKTGLDTLYGSGKDADLKKQIALTDMFGTKGGNSISDMIGAYGVYTEKVKAAGAATGDINKAFKDTEAHSFSQQMKELKASAEALGISLGNKLIPPLESVIKFFARHKAVAEGLVITIGALMALSVAWWFATLIGGIVAATAAMLGFDAAADANPIGAIVLLAEIAIVALIAIIYELVKHWKGVETGFRVAWEGIRIAWFATWDALKTAWHAVVYALEIAWRDTAGAFVTAWHAVIGALKTAWGGIVTAWHAVGSALSTAWHATLSALESAARPFVIAWRATIGGVETAWRAVTHALETAARATWNALKTAAVDTWHFLEPILKGLVTAINITLIPLRLLIAFWILTFRAITQVVMLFWHSVLEPFGKWFGSFVSGVFLTVLHALETAWRVSWNALGTAVSWVWNSVLQPTFHWIASAFDTVIGTGLRWLKTAWTATWNALSTAVSWVWNSVLQPTFHAIATAFDAVIGFALRTLQATWNAVWGTIKAALSATWNSFLLPTFHAIATAFDAVIGFALRLLEGTWNTVWGGIKTALSAIWNSFLSPTFHAIGGAFDSVIGAAGRAFQGTWNAIWGGIKSTVDWVWGAIKTVFDSISRAIRDITGGISSVAGKVGGFVGTLNKVLPFAEGGSPPVGRAVLVGEQGPELAVFGAPAYIHPAGETKSMLSGGKASGGWVGMPSQFGGAGGPSMTVVIEVPVNLDSQPIFKAVQKQSLRYNRRNPSNGLARIAGL